MAVLLPSVRGQKSGSTVFTIVSIAAAVALLYFGRAFFITVTIAVTLALILDSLVELLMRLRLPRALASFVACTFALAVVYLTGLGLYIQVVALVDESPEFRNRITLLVDRIDERVQEFEERIFQLVVPGRDRERKAAAETAQAEEAAGDRRRRSAEPPLPAASSAVPEVRIRQERPAWVEVVYNRLESVYQFLLFASFVPFLVYFILSWRDHLRRSLLQLFEGPERLIAARTWEGIADMARGYVVGNFLLAVMLAAVTSITFLFLELPYPLLLGTVSGFLSMVPYLGVPLAIVPAYLGALMVYDTIPPYVLLGSLVTVYHMLALNLLYPKVVGSKVHLNPLAVTLGIMFWLVLWGEVGLLLAIPITAGIKAICDNVAALQPYGKLLGD